MENFQLNNTFHRVWVLFFESEMRKYSWIKNIVAVGIGNNDAGVVGLNVAIMF